MDLLTLVEDLVARAGQVGLTPDGLVSIVLSRMSTHRDPSLVNVAFVECNPHSLDHYAAEIRRAMGLEVEVYLLDDLHHPQGRDAIARADVIASTFFHFNEVRTLVQVMGKHTPQVVAITVSPPLSVLEELSRLPPGSNLGIAYYAEDPFARDRLRRMTEVVRNVRLKHIKIKSVYLTPAPKPLVVATPRSSAGPSPLDSMAKIPSRL